MKSETRLFILSPTFQTASILSIHMAYQTSLRNERRVEATALLQHDAVREWMSWMSLLSLPLANYWNHLCYRGCFISTICIFHRLLVRKNMTNSCNSCTGAVLYLCISWSLNSASNSFFGNASKRFEDETLEGSQLQPPGVVSLALMWQCSRHVARIVFVKDSQKTIETDASKSCGKSRVSFVMMEKPCFRICRILNHGAVGLDEMSAL